MKKRLLFTCLLFPFCILPALAQYNNWATGFQLVEPSGVNLRKYFGENKAFDVSLGTYGLFYGRDRKYRKGNYRHAGVLLRATYLWHTPLFKKEQFHGYYGFGGQVNSRRYYFEPSNTPGVKVFTNTISLGGVGLAGLEYFLSSSPLSCFLEGGLYVEVLPAIFYLHPESSLGVRFNF